MLGHKSVYAAECFAGHFIGTDFGIDEDLSSKLPEEWRDFNRQFIPMYLAKHPDKTKISAGWRAARFGRSQRASNRRHRALPGWRRDTIALAKSSVTTTLPPAKFYLHRRMVRLARQSDCRAAMSEACRNSTGSIGTVANISRLPEEIERLIGIGTHANIDR